MQTRLDLRPVTSSSLLRGVFVGLAATQTLDVVSTYFYEKESTLFRFRENRVRGFKHAYERAVDVIAKKAGKKLSRREMKTWGWRFHKTFGVLTGVLYAIARRRSPRLGAGAGLALGAAFFLVADELLMPALRLTPGPRAFSWKVHARGAVSHVAYGVAAELTWRAFEKLGELTPKQPHSDVPPVPGANAEIGAIAKKVSKSLVDEVPARLA